MTARQRKDFSLPGGHSIGGLYGIFKTYQTTTKKGAKFSKMTSNWIFQPAPKAPEAGRCGGGRTTRRSSATWGGQSRAKTNFAPRPDIAGTRSRDRSRCADFARLYECHTARARVLASYRYRYCQSRLLLRPLRQLQLPHCHRRNRPWLHPLPMLRHCHCHSRFWLHLPRQLRRQPLLLRFHLRLHLCAERCGHFSGGGRSGNRCLHFQND